MPSPYEYTFKNVETELSRIITDVEPALRVIDIRITGLVGKYKAGRIETKEMLTDQVNAITVSLDEISSMLDTSITGLRNELNLLMYYTRSNPPANIAELEAEAGRITNILEENKISIRNKISNLRVQNSATLEIVPDEQADVPVLVEDSEFVSYPAQYIFPRNPELRKWVNVRRVTETYKEDADTIQSRTGQPLSSKKNSLDFTVGMGGIRNVIKLSSSPFIDYSMYDFIEKAWNVPPIVLKVGGNTDVFDRTNYSNKGLVTLTDVASSINDEIHFYFDGEKIITNFDFSNPEDRKRVTVEYTKLVNSIRVKAVLVNTSTSTVLSTPTVDQYTLVVGKQRTLN